MQTQFHSRSVTTALAVSLAVLASQALAQSANEESDIKDLTVAYPSDWPTAPEAASFRYFTSFTPSDPYYGYGSRSFLIGIDYDVQFRGFVLHQNPLTGALLPAALPKIGTGLMINRYSSAAPNWDGKDLNAYWTGVPTPGQATPTPSSKGAGWFDLRLQESVGYKSGSKGWADTMASVTGLALGFNAQTNLIVAAELVASHRFLTPPSVESAKVTYQGASFVFRTDQRVEDVYKDKTNVIGQAERIRIGAAVRTTDGDYLKLSDAATILGFDSFNFISVITHTNEPLINNQGKVFYPTPALPVLDPALGGWRGQAPGSVDHEAPYFNIEPTSDGAQIPRDTERVAYATFPSSPQAIFAFDPAVRYYASNAQDATALVFNDRPFAPDGTVGGSMKTDFVTFLVGVKQTCPAIKYKAGEPACFAYVPIGNAAFEWSSALGKITPIDTVPIPIQLQDLAPLDDSTPATPADLSALTFAEFAERYGVSPDEYIALAMQAAAVPEASTISLLLSGLLLLPVATRRRSQRLMTGTCGWRIQRRGWRPSRAAPSCSARSDA